MLAGFKKMEVSIFPTKTLRPQSCFKNKTKSRLGHAEYRVDSAVRVKTEILGPPKFLRFSTRVSLTLINLFLASAPWSRRHPGGDGSAHHFSHLLAGGSGRACAPRLSIISNISV